MTHKIYRVNLTLKDEVAKAFMSALTKQRRIEVESEQLNLTSASEYARVLIKQALNKTEIEGVHFPDKNINFRKDRNRLTITLYKNDVIKLREAYPNIKLEKDTKANVTISL